MSKLDDSPNNLLGFLLGIPLTALVLMWENHVIAQWNVHYWQWLIVSIPLCLFTLAENKLIRWVCGIVFAVTFIGQFVAWAGIATLPLIHG